MSGQLSELAIFTPLLIIVALLGKWLYVAWIDRDDNVRSTTQTATGLSRTAVRLLDLGHTAENFTTREFGYGASMRARQGARLVVYAGLIGAAVLFSAFDSTSAFLTLPLAAVATAIAVFAERWLFFVEAKQAVMLYHGRAHERPRQSTRTPRAFGGTAFAGKRVRSTTTVRSSSPKAGATRARSAD
jgi:DMSO reductase anchor subunit